MEALLLGRLDVSIGVLRASCPGRCVALTRLCAAQLRQVKCHGIRASVRAFSFTAIDVCQLLDWPSRRPRKSERVLVRSNWRSSTSNFVIVPRLSDVPFVCSLQNRPARQHVTRLMVRTWRERERERDGTFFSRSIAAPTERGGASDGSPSRVHSQRKLFIDWRPAPGASSEFTCRRVEGTNRRMDEWRSSCAAKSSIGTRIERKWPEASATNEHRLELISTLGESNQVRLNWIERD